MKIHIQIDRMGANTTAQTRAKAAREGFGIYFAGRWLEKRSTGKSGRRLYRSDEALRTPAFGALIDVMHEARLFRLGFDAGKAHVGAALHAFKVFVETFGSVLWHRQPHEWLMAPGKLGFHD
jgi:hypothetical protein